MRVVWFFFSTSHSSLKHIHTHALALSLSHSRTYVSGGGEGNKGFWERGWAQTTGVISPSPLFLCFENRSVYVCVCVCVCMCACVCVCMCVCVCEGEWKSPVPLQSSLSHSLTEVGWSWKDRLERTKRQERATTAVTKWSAQRGKNDYDSQSLMVNIKAYVWAIQIIRNTLGGEGVRRSVTVKAA
jgi:hypothetical protein